MGRATPTKTIVTPERVERTILLLRGHRVMLDADLAALYEVSVKRLNEQVRRNQERFPDDFMFQLSPAEAVSLRSQIATLKGGSRGLHRKYLPYAFTEQGVAMLSSVLRSPRAVRVNVEIMRAFVRLRRILESNAELASKLDALEARYDGQFRVVFQAIRELMTPPARGRRRIGFATGSGGVIAPKVVGKRHRTMFDRITFDPQVLGGRASIRGLRIPASVVVSQLAHGASHEEILKEYPDLEPDDLRQAMEYAAWLTHEELHPASPFD